jgi:hypothetical protein
LTRADRKALAARKAALKAQLAARRQAARAELERRRAAMPPVAEKPKRWPWILALIITLLLLLLSDCTCSPAPPPGVTAPAAPEPEPQAEPVPAPAPRKAPPKGRMPRLDRPEYTSAVPAVLPWVSRFQAQVEARSPRLAACFEGATRPGRLKWTAAVEPGSGQVSDHTLEPTVADESLTRQQRSCVLGVLSDPTYRLDDSAERATPSRVGLVIEF